MMLRALHRSVAGDASGALDPVTRKHLFIIPTQGVGIGARVSPVAGKAERIHLKDRVGRVDPEKFVSRGRVLMSVVA